MCRRWIDRVLVGAALLLVVGVAAQGIASQFGGGDEPEPPTKFAALAAEPVEPDASFTSTLQSIEVTPSGEGLARLVPLTDPEALFGVCSLALLQIDVRPGPMLRVRYTGPACEPPRIELDAVVRDPAGKRTRRVPALGPQGRLMVLRALEGSDRIVAPLADGLLRCRSGKPDDLRVDEVGTVRGSIPCRAQR